MFGNNWTKSYGEWTPEGEKQNPTIAIWGAALKDISSEQFQNGLVALSNSGSTFNPTAPQFKKMCIGDREHPEHIRVRQANAERLSLPKPARNKEVGRAALQKFKQKIGG